MKDPLKPGNETPFSDEELDDIHQQLLQADEQQPIDKEVARARAALQMIERVREAGNKETPRLNETLNEKPLPAELQQAWHDFTLPEKIGRFAIKQLVGQGGFGMVFLAHDPNLARDVALKIPRPEAVTTPELKARFVREGRAAASLAHPNIVPVYESGQIGPICYLASEYVDGTTLDVWREEQGELLYRQMATICHSVAEAIAHAHQRGVMHRDIKPANILIAKESEDSLAERIKITDFGLAKTIGDDTGQTQTGALIGTPSYMATEQARQQPATPASDIYSAGAVMYWLLTQQPPFSKNNIVETIQSIINEEPVRPRSLNSSIPADLEAICLKCLEKQPDRRYSTASALQNDLNRFLAGEPVLARSIGPATRMIRWCKRNQLATALLIVSTLSAIAVASLLYRSEDLRSISESRALQLTEKSTQLRTKTLQLQNTIQNLFVAVAESPEIMTPGNEPLRKRLMEEADKAYSQIEDDIYEHESLASQKLETKLRFAHLSFSLGEDRRADAVTDEMLDRLDTDLQKVESSSERQKLLLVKNSALVLRLKILAGDDETESRQSEIVDQILKLVDGDLQLHGAIEVELARARSLADLAANRMMTNATQSLELSSRAREIWRTIPVDQLAPSQAVDNLVATYQSAIQSLAYSEGSEEGLALCGEFFQIYDQLEAENPKIKPHTQMYLAEIYGSYAFLLRNSDIEEAIRKARHARDLASKLSEQHPLIGVYAASLTSQSYKFGLMHFIAGNFDQSETIFAENVERCQEIVVRFPGQSRTARFNLGNSLTMLGLIYKNREQWIQQIDTLQKSREINSRFAKSGRSQFVVSESGQIAEIALARSRLGEHELAMELIQESILPLEKILVKDPKNGQARRFLSNNVNRAIEINRRAGNFEAARAMLDKLVELLGTELQHSLLPHAIEIEIADGNLELADQYVDRYWNESAELNADQLKFDAAQFCWSIKTLASGAPDKSDQEQKLHDRLVETATQNLASWLEASDDYTASFDQVAGHSDFEPIHEEPEFLALAPD